MRSLILFLGLLLPTAALAQPSPPPPAAGAQEQEPIRLQQAVQEALNQNLELLARRFDINIADARILTAQMHPNPVLSLGADHLDWLGTGYNSVNMAGPTEYSVRTDWVMEGGGKRGYRIEVAELAKEVTRLELLDATRQLVLDVQNAFVEVLLEKGNLTLAQENRSAFERILRISRERVRAGDLSKVELMRTQLAKLQFDNAVLQAQVRLRTAKQRLQLLMGRATPEDQLDVEGDLPRDFVRRPLPQLQELALQNRPDYLALQRSQARSQADIRLQEAMGKLDYTVGMEYRRQQGLAGRGNSVGLFFSIPLPIFDTNEGEVQRAKMETEQLRTRVLALQVQIRQQLDSAWERYQAAEKLLDQIEANMLAQARQVLETMEYSYRSGHASLVELLDAQRAYNDTMLSYNEARAEFARTRFLLDSTIGAGQQPASAAPASLPDSQNGTRASQTP